METVQLPKEKLLAAYKKASAPGKKLLEQLHGGDVFKPNIMERVKSVQDACKALGRDYNKEFGKERTKWETPDETGYREIKMFYEALNEGWEPDYSDSNQAKYYAWVKWVSGRGWSVGVVGCGHAPATVGPRLVAKNEELVHHAFKCIYDSFKRFYNSKKNK